VWGRVRRTVESYREQAQASAADLATIISACTLIWQSITSRRAAWDAEEQLLNSTVKQYQDALDLTQSRFQGGLSSEVEVQQAKTQLDTTRALAI